MLQLAVLIRSYGKNIIYSLYHLILSLLSNCKGEAPPNTLRVYEGVLLEEFSAVLDKVEHNTVDDTGVGQHSVLVL